jgi:TonB family protein
LIKRVPPDIKAVSPGTRGVVILEIIIDRQGVPCSVIVLRSLRPDADAAAIAAAKEWRFVPARWKGQPWPVAWNVTVSFNQ